MEKLKFRIPPYMRPNPKRIIARFTMLRVIAALLMPMLRFYSPENGNVIPEMNRKRAKIVSWWRKPCHST